MNTQITQITPRDNLEFIVTAIDGNAGLQASTKHQYTKAVRNAVGAGVNLLDADAVTAYGLTIGSSTRSFLKAALRMLTHKLELDAKSGATPENVLSVQALVYRVEALNASIRIEKHAGSHAHTWLTPKQVRELFEACKTRKSGNAEADIVTQRDRIAIGLCVAAGLRRLEAVTLAFSDMVELQDGNGTTRHVLDVTGKGARRRVVPISSRLAIAIQEWHEIVGDGMVLRSLGRNRQLGDSLSPTALYNIVQKRGAIAGIENLQPHDLRRSFAHIGYAGGIKIAQIGRVLGHSNIQTTMRYLNIEDDLDATASDSVPF